MVVNVARQGSSDNPIEAFDLAIDLRMVNLLQSFTKAEPI